METLSITTPADVISFISHGLGYRPTETLVDTTIDDEQTGQILRVDLPAPDGDMTGYAWKVTKYFAADLNASGVAFAIFTDAPWTMDRPWPYAELVETLTHFLTERRIRVYDGFLVSESVYADYFCDDPRADQQSTRIQECDTNVINTELIYRGSNVQPNTVTLPPAAPHSNSGGAVEHFKGSIEAMNGLIAMARARTLWGAILDAGLIPTDQQTCELLADFQIPAIRDRLIADIPGIEEPIAQILMAQTRQAPRWSRVVWAELVLMHLYTHCDPSYAATVLTAIGYVSWWQGRGSKAIQFIDMALDANPHYRLAILIRQMLCASYIAGWAHDRHVAYRSL